MARCMQCGKELTHNEIGAHRKFINRGAEQFFCKQCLAEHLGVTPELIDEKIEQFVSAKYCYITHELRLHQNDRCKRFTPV